jgi:hypothetical protein
MVMQVLVLAVQNAVDYGDLGVATSGATLFRSIGGSLGTSILGAIFANRLRNELTSLLPARAASHVGGTAQVNPKQIDALPPPLRAAYLHAFTNSLNTVFEVAAGVGLIAFVAAWLIRELPLRDTVATDDHARTYVAPRDADSLVEIVNMIGRMDRREGAREIVQRVAARADVQLSAAACWLLARLSDPDCPGSHALATAFVVDRAMLERAEQELLKHQLIVTSGTAPSGFELSAAGHATLERLTRTGEQRLSELLECWRPQEHEDLARLIAALAREFFVDASALDARPAVAGAAS